MSKMDKFGSGALLTTLALSVSTAYADENKQDAAADKEKQAVELIKIHGVRNSIYNVKNQVTPAVWQTWLTRQPPSPF